MIFSAAFYCTVYLYVLSGEKKSVQIFCLLLKRLIYFLFYLCVYVRECTCMPHVCVGACEGQKRALNSQVLELQAVVGHLAWVLGIEARSGKTACLS